MALTKIKSEGIKDGEVGIADLSATGTASNSTFLRGDNSWTAVNTDLVSDTSPQLGGDLASNGNNILMADTDQIRLGALPDVRFYHDGNHSYLTNATGDFRLRSDSLKIEDQTNGHSMITAVADGAVELYHDNAKTAYTKSTGFEIKGGNTSDQTELQIIGNEGQDASILLGADDGDDNADYWRMYSHASDNAFTLKNYAAGSYETSIKAVGNGAVELYHDNVSKIKTQSFGADIFGQLQIAGHCTPSANNTYDLGTSSERWRNIYTNDLNLSNEGSSNDVDGTWGSYTIQEGADDLFLINKRNGKKYKFNLTEVS